MTPEEARRIIACTLSRSLYWTRTPEGPDFWLTICGCLRDNTWLPEIPPHTFQSCESIPRDLFSGSCLFIAQQIFEHEDVPYEEIYSWGAFINGRTFRFIDVRYVGNIATIRPSPLWSCILKLENYMDACVHKLKGNEGTSLSLINSRVENLGLVSSGGYTTPPKQDTPRKITYIPKGSSRVS
jgi:hypothetical protein